MHLVWLLWLIPIVIANNAFHSSFTPAHLRYLKNETKALFDHAWTSYMTFGFPMDEVKPVTCEPYGPDFSNPNDVIRNDVLGNISLTLLDNLDSLIILEKWDDLEMALEYLHREKSTFFDKDVIVQVFEMTIRSLGGLLSTHTILSDDSLIKSSRFKQISNKYDGFLLDMAHDLGKRLIGAFKTTNDIPVPRVNLKKGVKAVPYKLQMETCTSGVTTPVLEMTLLSKLTGDPQFEYHSQQTFWKIWNSRLGLDLLPMTISPIEGEWKDSITGIGASIDSFYEYCVKASILFNDLYMWEAFKSSYRALLTHLVKGTFEQFSPLLYANVGSNDGLDSTIWIDLLSAFWPGVQVLAGQLRDAVGTHMVFMKLWNHFQLIPERWNFLLRKESIRRKEDVIGLEWYPLRPEFIESTYYLYRATGDPMYLNIGEGILNTFKKRFKTKCGFKGVQDVRTGKFQNRMETFVLSETLKYLYLLFDTENKVFLHSKQMDRKNWVFSTEGHPLWVDFERPKTGLDLDEDFWNPANKESKKSFNPFKGMFHKKNALTDTTNKGVIYLPGPGDMVDHFQHKLEKCELNPFSQDSNEFMKSGYYQLSTLFSIDHDFQHYLYKPAYFFKENSFELAKDFYDKFTLFGAKLECPIPTTTNKMDLFLGDKSQIRDSVIHYIPQNQTLWIPIFNNLRLSLEFLQNGTVDHKHDLITRDFIDIQNMELSKQDSQVQLFDSIIRINKVNGIVISPEHSLLVSNFTVAQQEDTNQINAVRVVQNKLLLNGILVENIEIV